MSCDSPHFKPARNKIEKLDRLTRERATMMAERLKAHELERIATEGDADICRTLIEDAKRRLAEEDAAALRQFVEPLAFGLCATKDDVYALLESTQESAATVEHLRDALRRCRAIDSAATLDVPELLAFDQCSSMPEVFKLLEEVDCKDAANQNAALTRLQHLWEASRVAVPAIAASDIKTETVITADEPVGSAPGSPAQPPTEAVAAAHEDTPQATASDDPPAVTDIS